MTESERPDQRTALHLVPSGNSEEPTNEAVVDDATAALLLAQHGYRAAGHAAHGATIPSLTEFLD